MPQWVVTMSGAILVIFGQLLTAAFIYGKLTERVKTVDERTVDHGRRVTNLENVQNGPGGHGERLTAIESWRVMLTQKERDERDKERDEEHRKHRTLS